MNVALLLTRHAKGASDRQAVIDLTGKAPHVLTYAQMEDAASHAAAAFARSGLAPGARVAVLHPVNVTLYVAIAGMLRAGMVPVFFDPGARRAHFQSACSSVSPEAVFGSAAGLLYAATVPALASVRRRLTAGRFPGAIDITAEAGVLPVVAREASAPALITFTSGSTGVPKAIVRTHGLLCAQLDAICGMLPLSGVDVATMPIALLANLASGVTSVIPSVDLRRPGQADPRRLASDIERTHATSITASPAMLGGLTRADPAQLRSLRRIVTGGGPVMPSLMTALQCRLPQAQIVCVYGSSEAEPIASVTSSSVSESDLQAMRIGAGLLVGTPIAEAAVRICDDEIIVAGDHVVPGYLNGIGDEESKLRLDGRIWHRTGDGGYVDTSGRLWLTGRVQAVIRDDRGVIEPFRVECALSFDDEILRSALVGSQDRRVIAVEVRAGASVDRAALKRRLSWAHIDEVRVVPRLPVDRRHNAKIDYSRLRGLLRA